MEASFFRSFEAVNGALFARRLRRSKTIDSLKTSEVHASTRSTAWCVTERGGAAPVGKVWRRLRVVKFGDSYPAPVPPSSEGRVTVLACLTFGVHSTGLAPDFLSLNPGYACSIWTTRALLQRP